MSWRWSSGPDRDEALASINADYTEHYGFHDAENYLYKAPEANHQDSSSEKYLGVEVPSK